MTMIVYVAALGLKKGNYMEIDGVKGSERYLRKSRIYNLR